MLLEIFLGFIFTASAYSLWYKLSVRLASIIYLPDRVIAQRLHKNSAKFRLFILYLRKFYQGQYYRAIFWNNCGKLFYRVHIFFLKLDNLLVKILQYIRNNKINSGQKLNNFWKEIEEDIKYSNSVHIKKPSSFSYWEHIKRTKDDDQEVDD